MKKLRLKILNGLSAGRVIEIESDLLTIGRDRSCRLRFDANERIVSSKHAFIELRDDGFYIVDTNSTNGTYVNDQRVLSKKLQSGDVVSFGRDGVKALVEIYETVKTNPISAESSHSTLPSQKIQEPQKVDHGWEILPHSDKMAFQAEIPAPHGFDWKKSASYIGLSRPAEIDANSTKKTSHHVVVGAIILTVVFLSLVVILILTSSLGIIPAFVAAIVAFLPACFYILPLIFLDRYDPEPAWLLALAFAWGALVAIIFSIFINTIVSIVLGPTASAVISAPIFEEASKGAGLLILLIFFRKEFDDILDGIIYAGIIALGFATVENVLYYGRALLEEGIKGLLITFIVRGALSPFAHVTITAMTGIGCGLARESHNTTVRIFMPLIGYIAAVILHATWNGLASLGGEVFLLAYLVLEVPFFLLFVVFTIYIARRQNKILREMLAMDVARGLISKDQMEAATSIWKGLSWLTSGLKQGKFKARWRFLRAVGKLGLSYWHIQRAMAAQSYTGSIQQNPILRNEIIKLQSQI